MFLIDAIKAVASQLIVWHHLVAYTPMSDVLQPHATAVTGWLYNDARLAVQAFLVLGGFLAARSLAPHPSTAGDAFQGTGLWARLWSRYLRLALPYVIALAFAIACAALARNLVADPETPAAPTLPQVLAHVFLLQDIIEVDALSAGVWYVAIDFQLYALFALILWSSTGLARAFGTKVSHFVVALVGISALASLFWLNRDASLDLWAPYFFGAYGLGVFAHWATRSHHRGRWIAAMAGILIIALALDWRSRILVAGVTALLLASGIGSRTTLRAGTGWVVSALSRISYSVFLIHYPISMLIGALMLRAGFDGVAINITALGAVWLFSLGAGALLHNVAEGKFLRLANPVAVKSNRRS